MCDVQSEGFSHDGYVPDGLGIGGGDYLNFSFCLDCGQMQGEFPVPGIRDFVIEDKRKRLSYLNEQLQKNLEREGSSRSWERERRNESLRAQIAPLQQELEALEASDIHTQTETETPHA